MILKAVSSLCQCTPTFALVPLFFRYLIRSFYSFNEFPQLAFQSLALTYSVIISCLDSFLYFLYFIPTVLIFMTFFIALQGKSCLISKNNCKPYQLLIRCCNKTNNQGNLQKEEFIWAMVPKEQESTMAERQSSRQQAVGMVVRTEIEKFHPLL